VTGYSKQLVTA